MTDTSIIGAQLYYVERDNLRYITAHAPTDNGGGTILETWVPVAERDALRGDNRILRTEKHADAEAIATRRDINAENDRLTRRGMKKFTTIKGGKPAIAHAADMCEAVKSAVYDFADTVPLATAIGVLAIAQREILDEQE